MCNFFMLSSHISQELLYFTWSPGSAVLSELDPIEKTSVQHHGKD